jgi:competence protein ComEC
MPLHMTLRLVPVAGAAWVVAATVTLAPGAAGATALGLWAAALGCLVWSAGRGRRRVPATRRRGHGPVVVVLALCAAAAAASHVAAAQPARQDAAELEVTAGRAVEVEATVVGKVERRADGALAFDAIASRIDTGPRSHPVRMEVVVRVDPKDVADRRALDVGAAISARGTAAESRPGERAVLVIRATRGLEVTARATGPAAVASGLRQGLVAVASGLPGGGAGLVPGLAVGDTSAVSAELDAAMKESSLAHLTAVSGANCALVVGLVYAAAALIGLRRPTRVACGLAALVGFVLLVTPEPSVVRAGVMAAIAMLGVLLGRPGAGMAILALAVAVLLVADPWLAGSLGFALSAAATASLLLFARPLADGLTRFLPRILALALAVPTAAQLACGPLLVLIAPQVPLFGVLANLLAAPAAPLATTLGLAACLAAPVPVLQEGLAALAWLPASWIAATAMTVSEVPGGLLPWGEGWPGALSLAAVGLAAGVVVALGGGSARRRRLRVVSALLVTTTIGVLGGQGLLGSAAGRWTLPASWSILACDVGQGDAVLMRSAGAVALVDTGPEPEALDTCLARAGIDRIDLLVLTHFDLDHVGGIPSVIGRARTVVHGPADPEGARILAQLEAAGAQLFEASAGLTGRLGDARWRVLWPLAGSRAFPVGNDTSAVLDVRGGGIPPTLLLGDLAASPQRALRASGTLDAPYAVVKVAHHGSADQDAGLYRSAEPSFALVTVGADNDYGHPRAEILETLSAAGARIARTDSEGMIALWPTTGGIAIWRERGG